MQARLRDGSVLIAGMCGKDAVFKTVGERDSRVCTVSVAVGKKAVEGGGKAETIWCNLKAWHNLASILAQAKQGDSVLVAGLLESREHNGKTYTDLVAEYVNVASVSCAAASMTFSDAPSDPFAALSEDDGQLPF